MISLLKKLLGNSTAITLLFLSAASAMHESPEISGLTSSSSRLSSSVDPIEQERADSVANKREVIAGLIRDVEVLQAHEADEIDRFRDYVTPELNVIIVKNLQANEEILSILDKLQKNHLNKIKALQELLMLRYSFANSRRKNSLIFHENFINNPSDRGRILYGPTDPNIYDLLTPEQQILSTKATDKYQIFNRIILGIASMIDLRTLPGNTKRLLRASPTLCSLLEDSSKGFGHPDETFILEAAYKGQMSDWEYFTTHLLYTEKTTLDTYSSFHKEKRIISVTPYDKKFFEPTWQHPYALSELPYPEFLKPYPVERSKRAPLVTSTPSAPFSTLSSSFTPFATSSPVNPPPSIEFSSSNPLEELQKPAPFLIPEEPSLPVIEATASLLTQTDSEPISGILEVREESDSAAASSSASLIEELWSEIAQPEESQTSELAPPRPKGMRSFHARTPETTPSNHFVSLRVRPKTF